MITSTLLIILLLYFQSCAAVFIWHQIVSRTEELSMIGKEEIYFPVYNTLIALYLWVKRNPFK